MTDRDEQLLNNFFQAVREKQIEDGGFTERVMQSLPPMEAQTAKHGINWYARLSHIWTATCLLLAAVLFVVLDGWASLAVAVTTFCQLLVTQVSLFAMVLCIIAGGLWILSRTLRPEQSLLYQL